MGLLCSHHTPHCKICQAHFCPLDKLIFVVYYIKKEWYGNGFGKRKSIAKWLFEIGAARVDLLDVRQKNQEFDYMVLSCTAQTQGAKLIAAELIKFATSNNIPLQHTEGQYKGDWIVLDFGEFVVHILTGNTRTRFHLDKLWKTTKNQIQYK